MLPKRTPPTQSSATPACLALRASSRHTTRQSYQLSTSHKHKQETKNATVEKKTSAHWTKNASHKISFTYPVNKVSFDLPR